MIIKTTKFKETEIGTVPEEWEVLPIYDLAVWINGLAFRNINFSESGKPVVKINELKYGITEQTQFTNDSFKDVYCLKKEDLLFSWSGSPDTSIDAFWYDLPEGWLNQHIFKVSPKEKVIIDFLFYIFKANKQRFIEIARDKQTTGLGHVTIADLKRFLVSLPSQPEQKQIAEILSSLDDKIELNRQINANLEKIASSLFKHWFVDFEFPDKNGKPHRSNGGKMIDSELGEIPEGWKAGMLGEAIENFDSKRVPLSGQEREGRQGLYPYYGATSIMDYIDDYIFDGAFVLLGEDGSVAKEDGKPFVQYVFGKIWVNNHAHVLLGKNNFSTEYIKVFLDQVDIMPFVTGAVQPKLNQANMNSIPMIIPDQEILSKFNDILATIFGMILGNECQTKNLEQVRDFLLPRLMSGKIRVNI